MKRRTADSAEMRGERMMVTMTTRVFTAKQARGKNGECPGPRVELADDVDLNLDDRDRIECLPHGRVLR